MSNACKQNANSQCGDNDAKNFFHVFYPSFYFRMEYDNLTLLYNFERYRFP
jgi:hypothetical protein